MFQVETEGDGEKWVDYIEELTGQISYQAGMVQDLSLHCLCTADPQQSL